VEDPHIRDLRPQTAPVDLADPRLILRSLLRSALSSIEEGQVPWGELVRSLREWPFQVDAFLEEERVRRPHVVEALRRHLGLDPDPWVELVSGAISVHQQAETPEERILVAGSLLSQDGDELSGAVIGLCHHPLGLPLLVSMHSVARAGPLRRLLAGHLVRRSRAEELPLPDFRLNRESPAFHDGFIDGSLLVMVFREYPGVYGLFYCRLGDGVEDLIVVPVHGETALVGVLDQRGSAARERIGLDVCRARLAAAVAQVEDRLPSPTWQALGHIVEERLFHDEAHEGFVVGEVGARVILDRLAAVALGHEPRALLDLVRPASPAEVALELFGAQFVRHLLGVDHGVSRLEIRIEQEGELGGMAVAIGRSATGHALTNTRLHLSRAGEDWWVDRFELAGIGEEDQVLRPVLEGLFGRYTMPVLAFDDLPEAEQEVIAALLDLGFGLEDLAMALSQGRELQLVGSAGSVAAVTHYLFASGTGARAVLPELIDRYEGDEVEVEALLEKAWKSLCVVDLH
jgi:hypothetical protein